MPRLLVGMLVIGFGTSAPEMAVSALAASSGNTEIGLGNAYGSNIANIALILGLTALIHPIAVTLRECLRKELPILAVVTALAAYQVWDGRLTRLEAILLLVGFVGLLAWSIHKGLRHRSDAPARRHRAWYEGNAHRSVVVVAYGRSGAAHCQFSLTGLERCGDCKVTRRKRPGHRFNDRGPSGPRCRSWRSTVIAVRRGEHDIAVGNVLGSNLFNTLLVVGITVAIEPTVIPPEILSRDMVVMGGLTLALFVVCFGFRGPGRVQRFEGAALLSVFLRL